MVSVKCRHVHVVRLECYLDNRRLNHGGSLKGYDIMSVPKVCDFFLLQNSSESW